MPSNHRPSKHPVPVPGKVTVPGKVPVPMVEESDGKPSTKKILIISLVVLGLLLLLLLLLLLFAGKKGAGSGDRGTGTGTGLGVGDQEGDGTGIRDGVQDGGLQEGTQKDEEAGTQEDEKTGDQGDARNDHATVHQDGDKNSHDGTEPEGHALVLGEPDEQEIDNLPDLRDFQLPAPDEGGGMGDGAVVVRVFGVGGQGNKFMYVFDRSGSMSGRKLQEVKAELLRSLSVLNSKHRFNIIFYDHEFTVWKPGGKLIAASAPAKKEAGQFVQSIAAGGQTTHLPPLLEAITYKPDVIFFLTDGQSLQAGELDEICRKSGDISIHVIQYDDGSDGKSEILRQLALRNRGQYKYINVTASDAL